MDNEYAIPILFEEKSSSADCWRVNRHFVEFDALLHRHDFYEFEMVISGKGKFIVNGESYDVKKGFLCCMSISDMHEIHVDETIEVYNIAVLENMISPILLPLITSKESKAVYLDEDAFSQLSDIIEKLIFEQNGCDVFYQTAFSGLFQYFLVTLIRSLKLDTLKKYVNAPESVHKSIVYLNAHFTENPKLNDVAKMLYLDENYFCTLFKKCVGTGYKTYLKSLKLGHAAKLVNDTDMPIKDIYSKCGYSSKSPFFKEFKEHYGVTPAEMRECRKNEPHS